MRKIDQWTIDTIKGAYSECVRLGVNCERIKQNTRITINQREDGKTVASVYLHNNLIAQSSDGIEWGFKMCGFPTTTTKSRINALAFVFGRDGVYTKKGKHYSGKTEVNAYDWF